MSRLTKIRNRQRIAADERRRANPSLTKAAVLRDAPLSFFGAFIREPLKIGSVWPSSPGLSQLIADSCHIRSGANVVELGPGTGAFTGPLLERMKGQGRLIAVELNPANAAVLQSRFPKCEVIEDSAEHLHRHLKGHEADCIISGLAWGNMLPKAQNRMFKAILKSLAPGGQLVAFAYVHAFWFPTSVRFRRLLRRYFDQIETTPIVWKNLPPAFVFSCRRA